MTDSTHTGADAPALMQLPLRVHVCSWPLTLGPMIRQRSQARVNAERSNKTSPERWFDSNPDRGITCNPHNLSVHIAYRCGALTC